MMTDPETAPGPRSIMIFAAGLGTRMGDLTRDTPKPLIEVGGHTLLDHALALTGDAGVERCVVNIFAHASKIVLHLARHAPDTMVSQESERLETGGGLKNALHLLLPGPIFTLNADVVWRGRNPLTQLAAAWTPETGALLSVVPKSAATGHSGPGDFFLEPDGRLRRRGNAAAADYVFAGAQIIDPAALDPFPQGVFSLNRVWDRLIEEGRLRAVVYDGGWVDVGRPEGIGLAEAELAR